jgi:hypothetical protein
MGFKEPTQFGHHLGINIDSATCNFFAPADKFLKISTQARHLIGRATWNSRWLPIRDLQSLAGHVMNMFAGKSRRTSTKRISRAKCDTYNGAHPRTTPSQCCRRALTRSEQMRTEIKDANY